MKYLLPILLSGCTMMPWDREPERPDTTESRACEAKADEVARSTNDFDGSRWWYRYHEAEAYDECMGIKRRKV